MSLPLEMWVMIVRAGDLDAYDLIAMSAISRGWREAAHAMATFLPDEKRLAKVKPRSPDGVDRCNAWNLFASVYCSSYSHFQTHKEQLERAHTVSLSITALTHVHDLSLFAYLKAITIRTVLYMDVGVLRNLDSVSIEDGYKLKNVRFLQTVKHVHLQSLRDVPMDDIEALARVPDLSLITCGIRDATPFANVPCLNLSSNRLLSNVEQLDRVHVLDLSYCTHLTDQNIAPLGTVHTLRLCRCNVHDVSALGGVHTLDLSQCPLMSNVRALGNVYDLNLSGTRVADVSALGHVHTLNLDMCGQLKDVSALGKVHTLSLENTNVSDVSMLGGVHTLNLSYCRLVSRVVELGTCHALTLRGCPKIVHIERLNNVYDLNVDCCPGITAIYESMKKVHRLSLRGCVSLQKAHALNGVYDLDISGTGITDISVLGDVHILTTTRPRLEHYYTAHTTRPLIIRYV